MPLSNIGTVAVCATRDHFVMPNPASDLPAAGPPDDGNGGRGTEGGGPPFVDSRSSRSRSGPEVEQILDAGLVAHVGFVADARPYVLPMAYARIGGDLFLHGSVASRLVRTIGSGSRVCVTVTVLDGIVLARSAFNTSMNYRSVMVMGETEAIADPEARAPGLRGPARAIGAGSLRRCPGAEPERAASDPGRPAADRHLVGEGQLRPARRRHRRSLVPRLGGRDPPAARGRRVLSPRPVSPRTCSPTRPTRASRRAGEPWSRRRPMSRASVGSGSTRPWSSRSTSSSSGSTRRAARVASTPT